MKRTCARVVLLAALLLAGALAAPHAAERVAGEVSTDPALKQQGLSIQLNELRDRISASTARLMLIKRCHAEGKMFRTLEDGKEGCMSIISATVPAVTPGSLALTTPGTYTFTVPPYNTLTVTVNGAGGGGGAFVTGFIYAGSSGGTSSFDGVTAYGGGGSTPTYMARGYVYGTPGAQGGATGGDTNTPGGGSPGGCGDPCGASGGQAIKQWQASNGPAVGSTISVVVGAAGPGGTHYDVRWGTYTLYGVNGQPGSILISWQ